VRGGALAPFNHKRQEELKMKLWRAKNNAYTDYIRAESLDTAGDIFHVRHGEKATEFQIIDHRVFAVYFSGDPYPAYFKGTKKEALAGAKLYIKQWRLDETIASIQEI
jgi:hypothetical protein